MNARPYRHGDAFAGIGGFGLAARNVGWETVWACEIEPSARSVYAARLGHPGLRFDTDIRESRDLPEIDILTGGFPCQDLSVAGKRAGLAGGRSGLFFELVRILEERRPEWFVFENVPGLLSSHGGRDMAVVLSSLVECGYGVAYRVLNSQFFGVAQRRRRVFIVGHSSGDERRAAAVLFERAGVRRDSAAQSTARSGSAAFALRGIADYGGAFASLRADGGDVGGGSEVLVAHALTSTGFDASEDGSGRGTPLVAGALQGGGRTGYRVGAEAARDGYLIAPTLRCGGMADAKHAAGSSIDNTPLVYQCHGSNVGPIGALRRGNGNECGGVPFVALPSDRSALVGPASDGDRDVGTQAGLCGMALSANQRGEVRVSDVASALSQPGGKAGQGYPCVAFNWQAAGSSDFVGGRNPYTDALTRHQTPAVAIRTQNTSGNGHGLSDTHAHALNHAAPDAVFSPSVDPSGVRTSSELPRPLDLCPICQDGPDSPRYRGLGNAVTEHTARWILQRIEDQRNG